jgi:hypothetical protein
MARHFPSFLEAYYNYSEDHFCPSKFHHWVGRSIVAAALQRKVGLRQGKITHIPNIYVMLVSHPAVGKSTSMDVGMDLIEQLRSEHNPNFNIIPNQATEAALIKLMGVQERFEIPGAPDLLPHSSGFFFASEASASALQNTFGSFNSTLTAFYDCPKFFRKQLAGQNEMTVIENSCMNVLAGSTFEYLKSLVNEQTVFGGFASRLIYVVASERKVREAKWSEVHEVDYGMRGRLLEDLAQIHRLVGPVTATKDFMQCYEKWQPEFDQMRIDMNSPRLESLISRKGTNLIKLSIILSVSESNDLKVTQKHFEEASRIMDEVTEDNKLVLSMAMMANKESQSGVNQFIGQSLKRLGGKCSMAKLKQLAMMNGNNVQQLQMTIDMMIGSAMLKSDGTMIELLVDPDTHL